MPLFILIIAALFGQQAAPSAPASASSLDFDFFKTSVQPIFLAKRPGHARCITCHATGTPRLVALAPGASTWTFLESRRNPPKCQRLPDPGLPRASRLLMHPLAKQAGGDP